MGQFERNPLQGSSGEWGFTLMEGMVASAILSVGLLALAAMQGMSMVKNVDADELTRMTAVASDILERVQFNRRNAVSYNGIQTNNSATCNAIIQAQARGDCWLWSSLVTSTNLQNINGEITVSPTPLPPTVLGQRKVTVKLTWMGSQNGGQSIKRSRKLEMVRIVAPE